ncbi:sensor histidine kinase [Paraburkholderia lycopersici]|uniref:histidine kinase n=1 Tax=Paraburkholderia lycopersici TaxID=416944 RepID=A0A1G6N3L0_9BURK|nr:sensor histidine kinase [Paraburkholderia lycopersici]SDC62429.1 two-component system, OmpR family, sensor histidine kinase TctE [Paraburkholderia lycopersici]
MTASLRIRLLWWMLVPLALYVSFTATSEYRAARHTADLVQDGRLLSSARMIAGSVQWADGALRADVPPAALELFASPQQDQVFYNVRVEGGSLLAGMPDFPHAASAPAVDSPVWYDAALRGQAVRAVSVARSMYDNGRVSRVRVSVGKTARSRDAMVQALWRPQLYRQIGMVMLAVALACIGLTFELRPLMKLKNDVADRDPSHLEPIRAEGLHAELRPVVDAINQCIARLSAQTAAQRRFIADAAHQLRTPLTLLGTQLQYARQQKAVDTALDEVLAAMHVSNRSMVSLTNQLLLLAQAEALDPARVPAAPVDMAQLAREVAEALALLAQSRGIDLGAELAGEAIVAGHRELLRAMVSNLVDNALRYTPAGGHVTVSVRASEETVTLEVLDDGRGIPAETRARVFEPFFRAAADTEGTGLGLAIVREIAQSHRGEVRLSPGADGRGVRACVVLARWHPALADAARQT